MGNGEGVWVLWGGRSFKSGNRGAVWAVNWMGVDLIVRSRVLVVLGK